MYAFSQSSLQDYIDCARRFELRHIEDLIWPAIESEPASEVEHKQRNALLFHRLIQQHLLGMSADSLSSMAGSPDVSRWWQHFVSNGPDVRGWTLHPEKTLSARAGSHRLVCKYDLVAVRERRAIIYDWKTFGRRPTQEMLAARMQTQAYLAVLARAGAELNGGQPFQSADISMVYWFSEFPDQPVTFSYDDQRLNAAWRRISDLVEAIEGAAEFPLTDDRRHCRFCTYRSLCDRGQRAGEEGEADEQFVDLTASVADDALPADFGT